MEKEGKAAKDGKKVEIEEDDEEVSEDE